MMVFGCWMGWWFGGGGCFEFGDLSGFIWWCFVVLFGRWGGLNLGFGVVMCWIWDLCYLCVWLGLCGWFFWLFVCF